MTNPATRIPRFVLITYALPNVAVSMSFVLMSLYFFKFATDVLLIAPGLLGFIYGASKLWDALSDPLAGYWSDRTRSRLGRRRSWMLVAAVPFGLSIVMVWSPPEALTGLPLELWVAASLLLFYSMYTAFNVPYRALGAEMSQDYRERNHLFAWRQLGSALGLALALGAFYLLLEADSARPIHGVDTRSTALGVGLFVAVLVIATVLFSVARLRERPEHQGRGPDHPFRAFRDVLRNPHAMQLAIVESVHHFSIAALSLLGAYLFQYIMKAPPWMAAAFIGAYAVGVGLSIPIWVRMAGRYGKHRCWAAGLWGAAVGYSSLYFLLGAWSAPGPFAMGLACMAALVLGGLSAAGWLLGPSLQADVIDWDEYNSGQRKEGAYLATWNLIEKTATAAAAALLGVVLELSGYEPGVEQTGTTQTLILVLVSFVPGAGHALAALVFRGFALDEDEHIRIRAELDARVIAEGRA